ncbi:hypothetical protein Z945_3739 [Sulfitobacter noctilucae]|nr:hypothetical protein Z945_3739 [Sulfitobacter noctilucae]
MGQDYVKNQTYGFSAPHRLPPVLDGRTLPAPDACPKRQCGDSFQRIMQANRPFQPGL